MSFDIKNFIKELRKEFERIANPIIAQQQKDYVRGQFDYYGIKTPERREVLKPFFQKEYLPPIEELGQIICALWEQPQRDFLVSGLDLMFKYKKKLRSEDLNWLEYAIVTKSWWDTVDAVAIHLVGSYFLKYPEARDRTIEKWMNSGNMWLQRTCIIFQLRYKKEVDTKLLEKLISQLLGSKEFFINKAIGWMLRDYSKTNPNWVVDITNKYELSGLSRREALRLIK